MSKKRKALELENFGAGFDDESSSKTSEEKVEALVEDVAAILAREFGDESVTQEIIVQAESDVVDGGGFLPEASEEVLAEIEQEESDVVEASVDGTELESYDSAEIEEVEFVEAERLESILESVLFASDRPVSLASLKLLFKGTNIKTDKIRKALDNLAVEYAGGLRGVTLEEVPGGYQLRTKVDNMDFLRRTLKSRPFKLSGPAMEVMAITAYKQPIVKSEIDEIRGVESGHLLRALMEKGLVNFAGKSDLPGKPMQYGTTRKFLEIFGLRNLNELPTLSQIDELLPEGIGDETENEKPTLSSMTDALSEEVKVSSYSEGEEELMKISEQLEGITTSSDFFEQEKRRQRERRDDERAQNIRDALTLNEEVSTRDVNWLKKYDEALAAGTTLVQIEIETKAQRLAEMNKNFDRAETPEQEVGIVSQDTLPADAQDSVESQTAAEEVESLDEDQEHPDDLFLKDEIIDDEDSAEV